MATPQNPGIFANLGASAALVGGLASYFLQNNSNDLRQQELSLNAAQSSLAFADKVQDAITQTRNTIGQTLVSASAEGRLISSPTVASSTLGAYDYGAKLVANLTTEQRVSDLSYQMQKGQVADQQTLLPITSLSDMSKEFAMIHSNT